MIPEYRLRLAILISLLACGLDAANAQSGRQTDFVFVGSQREDELRLAQLRGSASLNGSLIRSPSLSWPDSGSRPAPTRLAALFGSRCALRWGVILPAASLSWNSEIPFARNDAGVWAGRGLTVAGNAGGYAECGFLKFRFVPDMWVAQNSRYPTPVSRELDRSGFAWQYIGLGRTYADIPSRYGDRLNVVFGLGQSVLEAQLPRVTVGFATESQWWGPAIRNAIVMSNHADGVPNLYLRTTSPLPTRWGDVEARWMIGVLSESPYFDREYNNDWRSLSGAIVTLRPKFDTTLTLGVARVVFAQIKNPGKVLPRFFDAVMRWGDVRHSIRDGHPAEQMTDLFARWIVPGRGLEVYGEWARSVMPRGLKALVVSPQESQGYTVGAQWLNTVDTTRAAWRTQIEFTNLEQLVPNRGLAMSYYTSGYVVQGYTQRGKVIGAAIGPGSSSQFLGVDRLVGSRSVGVFAGRTRWNEDSYFFEESGFSRYSHDVSLFGGLQVTHPWRVALLHGELLFEQRMNYLFQSGFNGYEEDHSLDVRNISFRLTVEPRSGR